LAEVRIACNQIGNILTCERRSLYEAFTRKASARVKSIVCRTFRARFSAVNGLVSSSTFAARRHHSITDASSAALFGARSTLQERRQQVVEVVSDAAAQRPTASD
jgi:hypothetical protein